MRRHFTIPLLAAVPLLLSSAVFSGEASAQTKVGASADIQAFRPAIDSRGYVTVNASQPLGHKELSFGLVTNWGKSVLTLEGNGGAKYEVENIISPTLVGAYGLKFGPAELELGVSLPFHIMSGDRGPDTDGGDPTMPATNKNFSFDGQGLGDIGVHLKTRFLSTSKGPKIGLGLIASLLLPTSSESDKWIGEEKLTPQIMGILDKEFGDERLLRVAFNGGIRLRAGTTFVDNQNGVAGADAESWAFRRGGGCKCLQRLLFVCFWGVGIGVA